MLGHQTLLLSAAQEAKVYSFGWIDNARMLFLWFVNVTAHFPAAKSQSRTMWSIEPLMNCGSAAWETKLQTAFVCPPSTKIASFVRIS